MAEGMKAREMTSASDIVKVNDFVTVALANTPGGIWRETHRMKEE
jgi:hypothetical protein